MTLAGTVLTAKIPLFWIKFLKSNKRWSKMLPVLEGEYKLVAWLQFCCDTVRKLNENCTALSLYRSERHSPANRFLSPGRSSISLFFILFLLCIVYLLLKLGSRECKVASGCWELSENWCYSPAAWLLHKLCSSQLAGLWSWTRCLHNRAGTSCVRC